MHSASIERDRLLLGIPDRRPDVIGQGNLAEKGEARRTSTLMRRIGFGLRIPWPPAFSLDVARRTWDPSLYDPFTTSLRRPFNGRGGEKE